MRNLSRDPSVVRRWAEARNARPGISDDGLLQLVMPDHEYTSERLLSWEEFAGIFTAEGLAFVYDEVPGSDFWAIGPEAEVRPFAEEAIPTHVP